MKKTVLTGIGTTITALLVVCAITLSCNKENENVTPVNSVDELVEQAAQEFISTPEASVDIPAIFLATQSGFDSNVKAAASPLTTCLRSVKLTNEQALKIRKALSVYEEQVKSIIKAHREEMSKLEAAYIAAKKEMLVKPVTDKAQRAEIEKKLTALKAELSKAMERLKESYSIKISAPYKELITSINNILDQRQWTLFSKCISR